MKGILTEIKKLERIRQVALPAGLFEDVPPHLVKVYGERVMAEKPHEVRRHSEAVRYTLLAAICWLRCREIIDNLVDLFIGIVKRIMTNAENTIDRRVPQEVKRVRGKGRLLFHIAKAVVAHPDGLVSEVVYPVASEQVLNQIVAEFQTILSIIIATLIIPGQAVIMPLLLLVANLLTLSFTEGIALTQGWLDSYHVQIIPFIASAFSIFLFYQFLQEIPKELDKAALVDEPTGFRSFTGSFCQFPGRATPRWPS